MAKTPWKKCRFESGHPSKNKTGIKLPQMQRPRGKSSNGRMGGVACQIRVRLPFSRKTSKSAGIQVAKGTFPQGRGRMLRLEQGSNSDATEVRLLPYAQTKLNHIPMFFAVKLKSGEENHNLIIEAESYTDAEVMAHNVAEVICTSMFEILLIVKTSYREIIESGTMKHPGDARFFKARLAIKEELANGKTKTTKMPVLVKAQDISDAFSELRIYCKGFVSDTEIFSVETTDINENFDKKSIEELVSSVSEV
jgi:hypothetical protein